MTDIDVDTPLLHVRCRCGGDPSAPPVLLLHGWPDDASTYDRVAPALHEAGWRTIAPFLRGFGATRFRSDTTVRSGEIPALAQDALDLADALQLDRFVVIGHDWGARAAYVLAALFPQRVRCCVALSVPWTPGPAATPPLPQVQAFWYQWFMATERGAETVRHDGKALARHMWDDWSPPGWFDDATFVQVARSFENPDWADITLHSYRVRWGHAAPDPRYAELASRLRDVRTIGIPTAMVQGGSDRVILPASSQGLQSNFSGPYERQLLDGVGHFPTREAPKALGERLERFLQQHA